MLRPLQPAPAAGSAGPHPAPTAGPEDAERRIEDWVVCHLDDADGPPAAGDWLGRLSASPLLGPASPTTPARPREATRDDGWRHLRATRVRGVTVARLLDRNLVRESDIDELAEELGALIDTGGHRLVLDLARVERLSSGVVGVLAAAHRRCAEADGGLLKLCRVSPGLADLFAIVGLERTLVLAPDEAEAVAGPWPEPKGPRPLPVAILSALTSRDGAGTLEAATEAPLRPAGLAVATSPEAAPPCVRLVVASGRGRGRAIPVEGPRLVLGRDPGCDLRTSCPTVSRRHAVVERRDGRAFVRDLNTTNGTLLNGQVLRDVEAELAHGDRLGIGPHAFLVEIGGVGAAPAESANPVDDLVLDWLRDDDGDDTPPSPSPATAEIDAGTTPAGPSSPLRTEVVEGVLVVTPLASRLDDEAAVAALRADLHALFERPLPRRVVVNLDRVAGLSSRAIGVLLAHSLRLDRAGGALRLGQVPARLRAALDHLRLPMLMATYPTLDEAVLESWD